MFYILSNNLDNGYMYTINKKFSDNALSCAGLIFITFMLASGASGKKNDEPPVIAETENSDSFIVLKEEIARQNFNSFD